MPDRPLPSDIDAERCVLGGMMMSKGAIHAVEEILTAADYTHGAHNIIHTAIFRLHNRDEPVDPVSVANELTRHGELQKIGGGPYLHTLLAAVPTAANAGYYAKIVQGKAVHRRLIEAGTRIVQAGYSGQDTADALELAARELDKVGGEHHTAALETSGELYLRVLEELDNPVDPGITTGWKDVDEVFRFRQSTFSVIAARTSVGKSLAAVNIAEHIGTDLRMPCVYFSLEMNAGELMRRRLAARARVDLNRLMKHELDDLDWVRINRAGGDLQDSLLQIDDESLTGLPQIKSRIRAMSRTGSWPKVIIIDLLGLMDEPPGAESRQVAVSGLSRGLKLISRQFDLAVIALVQVNRNPESRSDKRPLLSDLRESGSIESDADNVILLHRDDYYDPQNRPGEIDLIIAKHRNGPRCTIPLCFQPEYSRMVSLAA